MAEEVSERSVARLLDSIYDAALAPEGWQTVLEQLAGLFQCHFADLFTRSHDRLRYAGLAFGLDRADYQEQFLDTWFKRNVWGLSKPVRVSGEVLTTREMVEIADLKHSEIYADYLDPRGLHEGLRLAIWADGHGIQDISLLRSWSAGAFAAHEVELAHVLLPHLQRAAKVARRLHASETSFGGGLIALQAAGFAAILLDTAGKPVVLNEAAEVIVREQDGLSLQGDSLIAATNAANRALQSEFAKGLHPEALRRSGGSVRLPRPSGRTSLVLVTIPLRNGTTWLSLGEPALLVLITDPHASGPSAEQLSSLFGLTDTEADLAAQLLAGFDLREIATRRNRSVHTVRNHLVNLMGKTETTRQAELLNLLRGLPATPKQSEPGEGAARSIAPRVNG